MSTHNQNLAALEALLFIHGEPITYKKAGLALSLDEAACVQLAEELKKKLDDDDRGLQVLSDKEKIQLTTKPAFNGILEHFVKEELTEDLTPASLETLSIVVYLGPISRAKIEYLRGVNSSLILRSLAIRGLIERIPDHEHAAGFLYAPTFQVMKHLGIQKQGDLPEYQKFRELLTVFEATKADGEQ